MLQIQVAQLLVFPFVKYEASARYVVHLNKLLRCPSSVLEDQESQANELGDGGEEGEKWSRIRLIE